MTDEIAHSIGDGYPEYTEDERGYTYHASEVISAAESRRQEAIHRAPPEELQSLVQQFAPLSDLERWTLLQWYRRNEDWEAAANTAKSFFEIDLTHPALQFFEVFAEIARLGCLHDREDLVTRALDRLIDECPDSEKFLDLFRAQLHLYRGDPPSAHQGFLDHLPDDADTDLLFEIAEDFVRFDAPDLAQLWIDRAREHATGVDDSTSLVDLDLLQKSLDKRE